MEEIGYVLITGAGSGLGRSLAIEFAKRGFPVVLVGRTKSKVDDVSIECGTKYSLAIAADISKYVEVEHCFREANNWKGFPSIVISCAGEGVFGPLGSFRDEHIERVFSGGLIGTILVSQKAFIEMKGRGGIIMNIMSTAATVGKVNESIYCASKWGAKGFTEALKAEAKGTKVKVVAVYPGGIQTPFWSEKCGMYPDVNKFINPEELAKTLVESLLNKETLYIEDMLIRKA